MIKNSTIRLIWLCSSTDGDGIQCAWLMAHCTDYITITFQLLCGVFKLSVSSSLEQGFAFTCTILNTAATCGVTGEPS